MNLLRWTFTIFLPPIWGALSYIGFHYPGDEYGMWAGSSIAGLWGFLIVDSNITEDGPWVAIIAGVITMAVACVMLDLLKGRGRAVRGWAWAVLGFVWFLSSGMLLANALAGFESMERAISKNGSLTAYVVASMLFGLTIAVAVTLVGAAIWRGVRWVRGPNRRAATRPRSPVPR